MVSRALFAQHSLSTYSAIARTTRRLRRRSQIAASDAAVITIPFGRCGSRTPGGAQVERARVDMRDPNTSPRKNGAKTAKHTPEGRRFEPGNPGRPKGARNKTTLAIEALLDGEGEALTRKAIELAKAGDMQALRLCMERLCPPRKDRPISFALPKVETVADAVKANASILAAVANGDITPGEAAEVGKLLEMFARTVEVAELEERLTKLEQKVLQ